MAWQIEPFWPVYKGPQHQIHILIRLRYNSGRLTPLLMCKQSKTIMYRLIILRVCIYYVLHIPTAMYSSSQNTKSYAIKPLFLQYGNSKTADDLSDQKSNDHTSIWGAAFFISWIFSSYQISSLSKASTL